VPLKPEQAVDSVNTAVARPTHSPAEAVEFVHPPKRPGQNHLKGVALKAYTRQTKKIRQDEFILEFLPMVHKIVQQVVSFLRPPLSREDLVSAGTIGLVKAARDFDPTRDAEFKTYAYIRVRGAILDELRGWSFTPASVKKQFDQAQQLLRQITKQTGQVPSDEDLAQKLGMSVEKMYRMFESARAKHFLSIHGISDEAPALGASLVATDTNQPGDRMEQAELVGELTRQIQQLPEKQRKIIILYYHKALTMKQIASVLKITESRISQLHASALFKLSVKLRQWDDTRS
jgi:RNA polymerase sigma factor for flagellar operon FliA